MDVKPFRIERYYARYEFTTRYMLSSSDCESRTIEELLGLEPDAHARLLETWCGYTESPGAPELRAAIAALYERIDPDDVIVTSCAEEGILLVYHALLGAGDHAIVETPCYESALELARATGRRGQTSGGGATRTDGRTTSTRSSDRSAAEYAAALRQPAAQSDRDADGPGRRSSGSASSRARTGSCCSPTRSTASSSTIPRDRLPAACDLDAHAVSLGSISKTYGLPGLRLGWVVTRDAAIREAVMRTQGLHDDLLERPERGARRRSRCGTVTC